MSPILSVFNVKWSEFVNDTTVDSTIQFYIKGIGLLYLIASIFVLVLSVKSNKFIKWLIKFIALWQFIVFFLFTKESFFQIGQYLEYSLQLGLPFLLLYYYSSSFSFKRIIVILKWLVGITFFCHGLYALGFYPVPGNFIDMTIAILGISEDQSRVALLVVGFIDVLILPLLFINKTLKITAIYAVIWGFLTAFARIIANYVIDFPLETIHQYGFETVVRLCHGIGPLLLLLWNDKTTFVLNKENRN
ncbi:MAG: hypothetical protein HC854_12380 [Flavobacterium sp.]|nr:hypothetical protein [Flavobacterium sp.]